jgi:hypothetical protein
MSDHRVSASPAQEHRLRREEHARRHGIEPFPQRMFLGWLLPSGVRPEAAADAVRRLFTHHQQLQIVIGSPTDPLLLTRRPARDPVQFLDLEFGDFLAAQRLLLNTPTPPGSPAAYGYVNSDPSTGQKAVSLIVDHLVCDNHSLRVIESQFVTLLADPDSELPDDNIDAFIDAQWEAAARHREDAIAYYSARTYQEAISSPLPLAGAVNAPTWRINRASGRLSEDYQAELYRNGGLPTNFVARLLNDFGRALAKATGEEVNGVGLAVANRSNRYHDTVGWLANTLPVQLPARTLQDDAASIAEISHNLRTVHRWKNLHISQVIDAVEGRGDTPTSRQQPNCFVSIETTHAEPDVGSLESIELVKDRAYRGLALWLNLSKAESHFDMTVGTEVDPAAFDAIRAVLEDRRWRFEHPPTDEGSAG